MKKQKGSASTRQGGFTLMELLVVIAIIGILSSIVLASLNKARDKGQDAKVKAQLSGVKNAAVSYQDTNGDFGLATDACDNMFADGPSGMAAYTDLTNYPPNTNITCRSDGASYAMTGTLISTTDFWCVDSTGAAQEIPADLAAGDTTCN